MGAFFHERNIIILWKFYSGKLFLCTAFILAYHFFGHTTRFSIINLHLHIYDGSCFDLQAPTSLQIYSSLTGIKYIYIYIMGVTSKQGSFQGRPWKLIKKFIKFQHVFWAYLTWILNYRGSSCTKPLKYLYTTRTSIPKYNILKI